MKVYNILGLPS